MARRTTRRWTAGLLLTIGAAIATQACQSKHATTQPSADMSTSSSVHSASDLADSRAAFVAAYAVFMNPRCMNCHPNGDVPLQGDDSHLHLQNVTRGPEGKGVYALKCANCHQMTNLPGAHMPPGNPKWSLSKPETRMVFQGRTPAQLAAQLKDPTQNGGRTLEQIYHHVADDDLVGWGWNPGDGRTKPPLSREVFAAKMREWIDKGAAIPNN